MNLERENSFMERKSGEVLKSSGLDDSFRIFMTVKFAICHFGLKVMKLISKSLAERLMTQVFQMCIKILIAADVECHYSVKYNFYDYIAPIKLHNHGLVMCVMFLNVFHICKLCVFGMENILWL
jgi:hypothetical protein